MNIEVGAVFDGKVTGLTDFGAFVELEDGSVGMVHISEVAQSFVKNIRDYLSIDQQVRVKVISIAENGKINLSIKKASEESEQSHSVKKNRSSRPQAQVWQGTKKPDRTVPQTFEDMMAHFKQVSDEKNADLRRNSESKHGGYSRRK